MKRISAIVLFIRERKFYERNPGKHHREKSRIYPLDQRKNAVFDRSNSAEHLRKFSVLSLHSDGRMLEFESWLNHETPDAEFIEYGYGIIERHLAKAGLPFGRDWDDAHPPMWGMFCKHAARYIFYHVIQDI